MYTFKQQVCHSVIFHLDSFTELGLHPICRPTSLSENPSSSNAKARLRRSSRRSALPFSLDIAILNLNSYSLLSGLT